MVIDDGILPSVHAALADIPDPELPCSIVDLGLVEAVTVDAGGHVDITLLPTFTGCPALDMIANDVTRLVGDLDEVESCRVHWVFDPPWSTDRITEAGRTQLKAHGVTVPTCGGEPAGSSVEFRTTAVACPWCGSHETRLDSPFGPTRCRTIQYCEACQNTFEHMKRLDHEDEASSPGAG